MVGQTGFGLYVFYGLISLLLLAIVLVFLRTMFMFSLLWLYPVAMVLRRIPVLRLVVPKSVRDGELPPRPSRGS